MLTTNARSWKRRNLLRLACWNIRSWNRRDQEVILEMNNHNIDICTLSETKRRGRGTSKFENYVFIWCGKDKASRIAHSGVGILLHERFEPQIMNIKYISDRMLIVTLRMENKPTHFIAVYAPDTAKPIEEYRMFCEQLQDELDMISNTDKIFIMGDMNARVGNDIVEGVKQKFNEDVMNDHGEMLTELCAHNELRINNTFFPHKQQYKYTWSDTRGRHSTIDYIITNKRMHPRNILDVRTLTSANVDSDHGLVLCKIRMNKPPLIKTTPEYVQKMNIESLENESTKKLYKGRLSEKIEENSISNRDNVEQS